MRHAAAVNAADDDGFTHSCAPERTFAELAEGEDEPAPPEEPATEREFVASPEHPHNTAAMGMMRANVRKQDIDDREDGVAQLAMHGFRRDCRGGGSR